MARSTGPMLAVGSIVAANAIIAEDQPWESQLRTMTGAGIAAMLLYGAEQASPKLAVGMAYLALVGVAFVPMGGATKSPVQNLLDWWQNPPKVVPVAGRTPKGVPGAEGRVYFTDQKVPLVAPKTPPQPPGGTRFPTGLTIYPPSGAVLS